MQSGPDYCVEKDVRIDVEAQEVRDPPPVASLEFAKDVLLVDLVHRGRQVDHARNADELLDAGIAHGDAQHAPGRETIGHTRDLRDPKVILKVVESGDYVVNHTWQHEIQHPPFAFAHVVGRVETQYVHSVCN